MQKKNNYIFSQIKRKGAKSYEYHWKHAKVNRNLQ